MLPMLLVIFYPKKFLLIVIINFYIQIRLGSQYHFYMETHCALAIPDEDNCMVVYSSNQWPSNVHSVIAKCLGVPQHNVRVITRRVGGGFGGKGTRSMVVSICNSMWNRFLKNGSSQCISLNFQVKQDFLVMVFSQ